MNSIQQEINKNDVLNQVQELLKKQTEKGLEKYGQTVQPNELSTTEWLNHASEEIIDLLVYLQVLKQEQLNDEHVKEHLAKMYNHNFIHVRTDRNVAFADGIEYALNVLGIKVKGIND